ncbi:DUF2512 family protein [Evansella tamaricis]|uniref:YndM family protein n=1 Tax=Evansella tamaricis TaxID=2069301 RepID=A0ABS6JIA7_9BACI|nr:DUF2512 family protein [Evansella tamaricis]MBU9713115.1 YndM family protein [Evansella tamaricis]
MKHLQAFLIKYAFAVLVTLSALTILNASTAWVLAITLIVVVPAYLIGDLFLFPRFGHLIAGIADFGLYTLYFWFVVFGFIDMTATGFFAAVFTALSITFVEVFYHEFVISRMMNMRRYEPKPMLQKQLQTEFSEEIDPDIEKDPKK